MTININSTLDITIEKVNPVDKRWPETYYEDGVTHEGPLDTIEGFFLVKREQCHRRVGPGGKVNNISKEGNILPNKPTRDTTRLILGNNVKQALRSLPAMARDAS